MRKRLAMAAIATATAAIGGLSLPASAAPAGGGPGPLIVGGHDASEQYGWVAFMQVGGQPHCTGTLIDKQWVVTAAHCAKDVNPGDAEFRVGSNSRSNGGELVKAVDLKVHPQYDGSGPYDIAVAKLEHPVQAAPISKIADQKPQPGADVRELGWGQTCPTRGCGEEPDTLQELDTKIADPQGCKQAPDANFNPDLELCMDNHGGQASSCYGDSGGPAAIKDGDKWALVGATSRGQSDSCPEMPGIYTDVTAHKKWISEQTGIPFDHPALPGLPVPARH